MGDNRHRKALQFELLAAISRDKIAACRESRE